LAKIGRASLSAAVRKPIRAMCAPVRGRRRRGRGM